MKRRVVIVLVLFLLVALCGCNDTSRNISNYSSRQDHLSATSKESTSFSSVAEARQAVIDKWVNSGKAYECAKFIEDIYKQYYSDDTISNIYYYVIAKQQYDSYLEHPDYEGYREELENATLLIDPEYKGELSDEIQAFVSEIFPDGMPYQEHSEATSKQNNYDTMTISEKKKICKYIQKRYDYFDEKEGRDTGDKYSDQIWEEVMEQYGLEEWQVSVIWMNYYSY